MATKTYSFEIKDPSQIRDDILRTWRNEMIASGVPNPDATPGSDIYNFATAIANELSVIHANTAVKADDLMPDTATGEDLDRAMATVGLVRQQAGGSTGNITLDSSASTNITTGTQLIDSQGLRYEVTVGGSYTNGATVPIAAVDTGILTNLAAGATLQWGTPPAYSAPTAVVAAGGLVNGVDEEDDESARARLQAYYANPPAGGNWEHVALLAETSDPSVQKAFVYPAAQGPGTCHVCVVAAPTSTSKSRVLNGTTLSSTVTPYVTGKLAEHVAFTVTTVDDVTCNVGFNLTLPSAPTASPPGPGGGWLDGTPWPSRASQGYCDVTAVTSSTIITVNADVAPVSLVSRIAWLSPIDWKLYTARVLQVSGSGPYTISLDTPFTGIAIGHFIFPQCSNQQAYVDAVLAQFALTGPGEKTDNVTVLQRAYRHPVPQYSWPYSLAGQMLRAVSNVGDEVLDVSYGYQQAIKPDVPALVTGNPGILIPNCIGFYPTPNA